MGGQRQRAPQVQLALSYRQVADDDSPHVSESTLQDRERYTQLDDAFTTNRERSTCCVLRWTCLDTASLLGLREAIITYSYHSLNINHSIDFQRISILLIYRNNYHMIP